MMGPNPGNPLGFLMMMLQTRVEHARKAERGASAVEWVVIAAIVVGICIAVGFVLKSALQGKADEVGNQIGESGS